MKQLIGYADADGSMAEDRKAISGYTFMINGGAVSWSAKRQQIISLSTTESKYIAATYAAKEALWLRQLILQLLASTWMRPLFSPTISRPSHSQKNTSITPVPNTLMFVFTSLDGSSRKAKFDSFIVQLMKWSPTYSQKLYPQRKSNTSLMNLVSCCLEEECWSMDSEGVRMRRTHRSRR